MSKDYFDISKRAIDDEVRNISKTEKGSGILGIRNSGVRGSKKTNAVVVAAARGEVPATDG